MRRSGDHREQIDELDGKLLSLLADEPRISNVALGALAGVSDETVAARLKKLLATNSLAMTALVDWERAGYGAHGIVRVRIAHGAPEAAVAPLVEEASVHVVAVTTGICEVVVGLMAADLPALRAEFIRTVRALESVIGASMSVVTEPCRHDLHATTLPLEGWHSRLLAGSPVGLDDLDLRLIDLLVSDAHESNRWLARRLEVNDGTVRSRLQRLEDAGLLRLAAVRDTVTLGDVGSAAFVFIDVAGDDSDVVAALMAHPGIGRLDRCLGDASLVALATAANENELHAFLSNEVRSLKNVVRVEVATVLEALHHKANLVRLL